MVSKIVGVELRPERDEFTFSGVSLAGDAVVTKHLVLSCIAWIFDPLG